MGTVVPGRMLGEDHVWACVVRVRYSGTEMMLFKATGVEQLFSVGYSSTRFLVLFLKQLSFTLSVVIFTPRAWIVHTKIIS